MSPAPRPRGSARSSFGSARPGWCHSGALVPPCATQPNRDHLLWPAIQRLVVDADQVVHLLKVRIAESVRELIDDAGVFGRISLALYGSVARGEARPGSDIDILLITPDETHPDRVESLVGAIMEVATSATGNDCSVYAATPSRIDELIATGDPMIPSWSVDAHTFHGPDFRRRLSEAPWDEPAA